MSASCSNSGLGPGCYRISPGISHSGVARAPVPVIARATLEEVPPSTDARVGPGIYDVVNITGIAHNINYKIAYGSFSSLPRLSGSRRSISSRSENKKTRVVMRSKRKSCLR
jgi:hypothetical protein